MMYILDTNVLSEFRRIKIGKADPKVAAWAEVAYADDLFLSAMTIMELEIGILLLERKDISQGFVLRTWLNEYVLPEFSDRILPFDTQVAQRCARLHIPNKRAERDAIIAATALVYDLTVVTRNVADFQPTGVSILNPWG